ncbi:hypothetical protein [Sulfuricurvum sp.]|uniref:hypothetical protein n=1 Tax=Sulfuricurvum sp. TaxID=2025608 RepID=UPI003BB58BBB
MGLVKSLWMEQQEEHAYEEKVEWIRESLMIWKQMNILMDGLKPKKNMKIIYE